MTNPPVRDMLTPYQWDEIDMSCESCGMPLEPYEIDAGETICSCCIG